MKLELLKKHITFFLQLIAGCRRKFRVWRTSDEFSEKQLCIIKPATAEKHG